MRNPFLLGSTIYLRPIELEDAATVATWLNDPEVRHFLRGRLPLTRFAEEAFLRRISESDNDFVVGIVVREKDQFIGVLGLHQLDNRNRHAKFGITLGDKNCWNKGYGTEATTVILRFAFQTLNLNRVWLHVYEFNERAQHVYEKIGFRTEGRMRQDTFREGRYWDTIVMGLLSDEWTARQQGEKD
jgi:RimJ/RimL family protein N-acetyltransferase